MLATNNTPFLPSVLGRNLRSTLLFQKMTIVSIPCECPLTAGDRTPAQTSIQIHRALRVQRVPAQTDR